MALVDQIIGAESGGNPNARNPRSSASGALRPSHVSNEFGANALVAKLHLASRPSTVFWGVIAIVIDAIKGVLCAWARPHIGKEILKSGPAVTNLNAPSSIVFVRSMFRKFAASLHSVPYLIFGGGLPAALNRLRHAVRLGALPRFRQNTSAARCIAGTKIGDRDNLFCTAVARTQHLANRRSPIFSNFWLRFLNYSEFSKLYSNAIYRGCH